MEHHTPNTEETEKDMCFQTIALTINTIEVLKHQWTISHRHFIHICTNNCAIILIHYHSMDSSHHHPHSSLKLLPSRHANHQIILMYRYVKKQQGTGRSYVTVVPLQTPSLSTSSKWNMSYLPSTGFDEILTLSLQTVFTKSTNKQSLEMTTPAPCKPLILCVELEYILAPLLILFTWSYSTFSIDVIPEPIAPILLELRFAN